ncbi:hypothetical protein N9764_05665 [Polaribacter sp.]|nr:hypothetical protein [Polaribacter sp.]
MKKIVLILLFFGTISYGQTKGISYQALILDPVVQELPGFNNELAPLANKTICLKFSILDELSSLEYEEIFTTTTDDVGMVNLIIGIGDGTITGGYAGSFEDIIWSALAKNLKIDLSLDESCAIFTEISNSPFTAVPFALFAVNTQDTPLVLENEAEIILLKALLAATQTGAGLNANGTYSANASSNFITGATSLNNADTILDSQVKNNEDAITANTTAIVANKTDINTKVPISAIVDDLTTGGSTVPLSAEQGKVLKNLVATSVTIAVEDNLTSTSTTNALSANQGKVLKGLVDTNVTSISTNTSSIAANTLDISGAVMKTGDQTIAGAKTFNDTIIGNISGNAATATKFANTADINGVAFDGSADITITADANTLTGTTLASNVLASSLTSVGTLTDLTVTNPIAGSITGNATTTTGLNTTTDGIVKTTNSDGTLSIGTIALNELSNAFFNSTENNLVVGHIPGNITSGTGNFAFSNSGLTNLTSGLYNNVFGSEALQNLTTGNSNTAMGQKSMLSLVDGSSNTAFGQGTLFDLTSGGNNIAVGVGAGSGNQTGSYNTAIGNGALAGLWPATESNSSNTAVGFQAGNGITTGSDNVFIGKSAGNTIDDGSSNVVIGDDADVSVPNSINEIVIGKGATGVGDNIAVIGNASTEKVYMSEDAGAVVYTACIKTSAGALTLNGAAGVNIAGNAAEVDVTTTGAVDINGAAITVDATSGISLDAAAASNITTSVGALTLNGAAGVAIASTGVITTIKGTTTSTNSTTGALVVDGGVGIAENLNVGGTINVTGGLIGRINDITEDDFADSENNVTINAYAGSFLFSRSEVFNSSIKKIYNSLVGENSIIIVQQVKSILTSGSTTVLQNIILLSEVSDGFFSIDVGSTAPPATEKLKFNFLVFN